MKKRVKNGIRIYVVLVAIMVILAGVGAIVAGQALGIFTIFQPPEKAISYSPYAKDVYTVQLFKSGDSVGFSLVVRERAIPSYFKIGDYELRSLDAHGNVLESIKFNFDDTIMVDPNPECITDEGIVITGTPECPAFDSVIQKEDTSIILNMQYFDEIAEFQLLKEGEILAINKLTEEPTSGQDPFSELIEQQRISQTGIVDIEAQRLFETGYLETSESVV